LAPLLRRRSERVSSLAIWNTVCRGRAARGSLIPSSQPACEDISDIVKREYGRGARESVRPAVMFGKHTVVDPETGLPLVFL
jgi:hypothetical protein